MEGDNNNSVCTKKEDHTENICEGMDHLAIAKSLQMISSENMHRVSRIVSVCIRALQKLSHAISTKASFDIMSAIEYIDHILDCMPWIAAAYPLPDIDLPNLLPHPNEPNDNSHKCTSVEKAIPIINLLLSHLEGLKDSPSVDTHYTHCVCVYHYLRCLRFLLEQIGRSSVMSPTTQEIVVDCNSSHHMVQTCVDIQNNTKSITVNDPYKTFDTVYREIHDTIDVLMDGIASVNETTRLPEKGDPLSNQAEWRDKFQRFSTEIVETLQRTTFMLKTVIQTIVNAVLSSNSMQTTTYYWIPMYKYIEERADELIRSMHEKKSMSPDHKLLARLKDMLLNMVSQAKILVNYTRKRIIDKEPNTVSHIVLQIATLLDDLFLTHSVLHVIRNYGFVPQRRQLEKNL